jgi:uroporphyrin-III C-methyltransferase/precorrin-2 dehydrogenase/sirohydrochlorin ferrochelatase
MHALATLPVFFKLAGKRAVVAGGDDPALWKAELLAAAGARVDVYSDAFADGFAELSHAPPAGSVTLHHRSWHVEDLAGAAIAIGACTNDADAEAFAAAARDAGVPVNVIDRPAFCDFQFGAIVNRSPLVVAISTDGGAPVFGQAIRSLIEALLPNGFRRWAEAAKTWRSKGDRLGETPAAKRRFWERFADMAMQNAARAPVDSDLVQLLSDAEISKNAVQPVTIIEVGDNVETLTLAAVRALRRGDLIVFENDVPRAVLDFARREARRHAHASGGEELAASVDEMIGTAAAGKHVICLRRMQQKPGRGADDTTKSIENALQKAGMSVVILSSAAPPL